MKVVIKMLILLYLLTLVFNIKIKTSEQNDELATNERLESKNGAYFAVMQGDGNFVVYSKKGRNGRNKDNPVWASNTNGKGKSPRKIVIQEDGNVVLYDASKKPLWASNSNGKGSKPYNLIMQDDGNLVLYDKDKKPRWASNTNGRK